MINRIIIALLVTITAMFAGERTSAVEFTSSNLPIIIIKTNGQTIVDEPKITADMKVIFNGEGKRNTVTDTVVIYNGKIGIEIRGSSSQMFPKKQYGFETRDAFGAELDVSLFGMPVESDWILSAPYNDKSLMRDAMTYSISNAIGRYASRTRYCELVLNGEYMGVYILMEKIKRDKGRVNITKIDTAAVSGDLLSGGYIVKIDKLSGSGNDGWYSSFLPRPGSPFKINYLYEYPKSEDITASEKLYIKNFFLQFETVFSGPSYIDSVNGYRKFIDLPSMVDYFLINELGKNVDGFRLSSYMHKDKDSKNPKLILGPVWDFNHAYGNSDYYEASNISGWQMTWFNTNTAFQNGDTWQPPFWWFKAMEDSAFNRLAVSRWKALRMKQLTTVKVHAFIDSVASLVDEAQQRNFVRWPILNQYVWPNAYIGGTYAKEIAYLKNWVFQRLTWMDWKLTGGPVSVDEASGTAPASFGLSQNYPNPFNPATTIEFTVGGEAGSNGVLVTLEVFDVLGNTVQTLVKERRSSGKYIVHFNASHLPSGLYFYRLQSGNNLLTKKLVLVK